MTETVNELTPKQLIDRYNISLAEERPGCFYSPNARKIRADHAEEILRKNKPEIMRILTAEKEEREREIAEYNKKVQSIPGLAEIEAAEEDVESWRKEWEASFDDVGALESDRSRSTISKRCAQPIRRRTPTLKPAQRPKATTTHLPQSVIEP